MDLFQKILEFHMYIHLSLGTQRFPQYPARAHPLNELMYMQVFWKHYKQTRGYRSQWTKFPDIK